MTKCFATSDLSVPKTAGWRRVNADELKVLVSGAATRAEHMRTAAAVG